MDSHHDNKYGEALPIKELPPEAMTEIARLVTMPFDEHAASVNIPPEVVQMVEHTPHYLRKNTQHPFAKFIKKPRR